MAVEPSARRGQLNVSTARLAELITQIGPSIPEIARRLGQYKESVRYRYKEKILKYGFAVQASIDYEKIGLRHIEMVVDFSKDFRDYAQSVLAAMSDICYIAGFEKLFPKGDYFVRADVPEEFVEPFEDFLDALRGKGVFESIEVHDFDWFRRIPMRAKFYNFEAGVWDFDWTNQSKVDLELGSYVPSRKTRFDYVDLFILKELYIDASRSLVEISKKLGTNYKSLAWHYRTHVLGRGLIKNYTIRWPGTKYDFKADRALHRQHRYFWVDILAKDLNDVERMEVMAGVGSLPFLWAEASGKDYFAQLAFPVDFYTEAMQRLQEILKPVRERAALYFPDQTNALSFVISHGLFDREANKWTFNQASLEGRFDELMLKIREKGG